MHAEHWLRRRRTEALIFKALSHVTWLSGQNWRYVIRNWLIGHNWHNWHNWHTTLTNWRNILAERHRTLPNDVDRSYGERVFWVEYGCRMVVQLISTAADDHYRFAAATVKKAWNRLAVRRTVGIHRKTTSHTPGIAMKRHVWLWANTLAYSITLASYEVTPWKLGSLASVWRSKHSLCYQALHLEVASDIPLFSLARRFAWWAKHIT